MDRVKQNNLNMDVGDIQLDGGPGHRGPRTGHQNPCS